MIIVNMTLNNEFNDSLDACCDSRSPPGPPGSMNPESEMHAGGECYQVGANFHPPCAYYTCEDQSSPMFHAQDGV